MKRILIVLSSVAAFSISSAALAGEAATSASAGGARGASHGVASASAAYEGEVGFARTDTHSGKINLARGVAVGIDKEGLSLSVSNAIAPRFGPAIATNFNLAIGRDGEVSASHGLSIADGPIHREASAGGSARSGGGAISTASGKSDPFGRVQASSGASSSVPRIVSERRGPVVVAGRGEILVPRAVASSARRAPVVLRRP